MPAMTDQRAAEHTAQRRKDNFGAGADLRDRIEFIVVGMDTPKLERGMGGPRK
jgi:hypothetical protein